MFKLVTTRTAKATLVTLSNQVPESYSEVHLTLMAARRGLAATTLIGVVNHAHDVHFLEPTGPGKPMLVLTDYTVKPDRLVLIDFPAFPDLASLSRADKKRLSEQAANDASIFAYNVYIP